MGLKELAEGIILQCMEDLSEEAYRQESIHFFEGSGFAICAEIAGLDSGNKIDLLNFVKTLMESGKRHCRKKTQPGRRETGSYRQGNVPLLIQKGRPTF